jgi:hypothetical protein
MRVRDTWLLEDFHSFDEPADWSIAPELKPSPRRDEPEESGFRSLLEDPEACWMGMDS